MALAVLKYAIISPRGDTDAQFGNGSPNDALPVEVVKISEKLSRR